MRRNGAVESRADLLVKADAKDEAGEHIKVKEADVLYASTYPPPPSVDSWVIAHCKEHGFPLVIAPQEADSQAGCLVADDLVDVLVTIDSDLARSFPHSLCSCPLMAIAHPHTTSGRLSVVNLENGRRRTPG